MNVFRKKSKSPGKPLRRYPPVRMNEDYDGSEEYDVPNDLAIGSRHKYTIASLRVQGEHGIRPGVLHLNPQHRSEKPDQDLDNSRSLGEREYDRRKGQIVKTPSTHPETSQKAQPSKQEESRPVNDSQAADEAIQAADEEPRVEGEELHNVEVELQKKEKDRQKKDKKLHDLYLQTVESKDKYEQDFQKTNEQYEQGSKELDLWYEKEKGHRGKYMELMSNHKHLWDQHEQLLKQHLEERKLRSQSEKERDAASTQFLQIGALYEDEKKAMEILKLKLQAYGECVHELERFRDMFESAQDENVIIRQEIQKLTTDNKQIQDQLEQETRLSKEREQDLTTLIKDGEWQRWEAAHAMEVMEEKLKRQLSIMQKESEDKILRLTIEFEEQLRTTTDEKEELLRQMKRDRQRLSDKNIAQELLSKDKV